MTPEDNTASIARRHEEAQNARGYTQMRHLLDKPAHSWPRCEVVMPSQVEQAIEAEFQALQQTRRANGSNGGKP